MKYLTRFAGEEREFVLERSAGKLVARSGDRTYAIDLALVGDGTTFSLLVDGRSYGPLKALCEVALQQRFEPAADLLFARDVIAVEDRVAHLATQTGKQV